MKTFEDLEFKEHGNSKSAKLAIEKQPSLKDCFADMIGAQQAIVELDNGIELSVIIGKCFYSNGIDTYECYAIDEGEEPRGHLSKEKVTEYMKELQS